MSTAIMDILETVFYITVLLLFLYKLTRGRVICQLFAGIHKLTEGRVSSSFA